ncbi:glucan endo-1,3-beta-glucosidase 8-like [Aristolochia californica]|uniref:glucan endo-1,3-beta-glucosidase 8-like n=1 Tax=Aristolochia californica TaxID=171875 RepID=UPI0035DA3429
MIRAHSAMIWLSTGLLLCATLVQGIGVNWGTMASHLLPPSTVVEMIKANNIQKVKLFDADSWTVSSLAGTDIQVIVAIPNDMLHLMSKDYKNAQEWVKQNVTRHLYDGGVDIRYVAVGNEPFLKSYNETFVNDTLPALQNIQKALDEAGVGGKIKATVPLNADVYGSPAHQPVPSTGNFRSDIRSVMQTIVKFLNSSKAPFIVNIYPFLSLYYSSDFPEDFAFFDDTGKGLDDGGKHYDNVFEANYDTLVWSLKRAGVPDLKIVVGEVGWPTDGDKHATVKNAKRFYDGFLKRLAAKKGTPLRPGPLEVYLFGLLDEDQKSIAPGNFERHWGIFSYDGKPKFPMDLTGHGNDKNLLPAKGVQYLEKQWCVLNKEAKSTSKLPANMDYACSNGDCTALGYGCSCNNLDASANASYAFNMYFQMQDQDVQACNFNGLAKITTKNMSQGDCLFPIQIENGSERLSLTPRSVALTLLSVLIALVSL